MKKTVKIKKYSHTVTEMTQLKEWSPFAEKIVRLLNSDLKDIYPATFYFLQTEIKGNLKVYAGSDENLSYSNDPAFTQVLQHYEPHSLDGDYTKKRRKGS